MDPSSVQHQRAVTRKIWGTAVNTLLSAMESILLDEDQRSLWPREQRSQDPKKKIYLPSTPTLPLSHDPTFSPPLKRKHDPLILSDRGTKSQRMTDHLTAQLATRLHVSQSDQEPIMINTTSQLTPRSDFQLTLPSRQKLRRQQPKEDDDMMDNDQTPPPNNNIPERSGLDGFHMQQDSGDSSSTTTSPSSASASATGGAARKYRTPTRNRSGPSTPVNSHPPSPSPFSSQFPYMGNTAPDTLGTNIAWSSSQSQHPHYQPQHQQLAPLHPPPQGLGIAPDATPQGGGSGYNINLLFRRGSRLGSMIKSSSSSLSSAAASSSSSSLQHHPMAMATRLALFHRVLEASNSESGRTLDISTWITRQASRHNFTDRTVFEQALTAKIQALEHHMAQLHDLFLHKRTRGVADEIPIRKEPIYTSWSHPWEHNGSSNNSWGYDGKSNSNSNPELSYSVIQATTDTILELLCWICGPDFDMNLGRLCPRWQMHSSSLEQIVHYVQVIESMRETVSGQFHHPIDLAEDLAHCQEVIDYQRTLFGEILRNKGLSWRALGLPIMEPLIESTQLWIINLAKVLTVKIQAEVNLTIHYYQQQLEDASNKAGGGTGAIDLDKCPGMESKMAMRSRSMAEVMELVLQGALLANSCLELAGLPCPMLVTSWLALSTPYTWYALTSRQQFISKTSAQQQMKKKRVSSALSLGMTMDAEQGTTSSSVLSLSSRSATDLSTPAETPNTSARTSRGSFLKSMALFENVSRLLQCLMEMREGEEMLIQESRVRQSSFHDSNGGFGSGSNNNMGNGGLDDFTMVAGGVQNIIKDTTEGDTSTASSDQDDAMDGVTTSSLSAYSSPSGNLNGYNTSSSSTSSSSHLLHPHHLSRSPSSNRRRSPLSPVTLAAQERLKATEELASILVEAGLELCSSMAEALGLGHNPTSSSPSSPIRPASSRPTTRTLQAVGKSSLFRSNDSSNPFAYDTLMQTPLSSSLFDGVSQLTTGSTSSTRRNRGAVAVAALTALGGGGAMASGSGGVGMIYVQFVVRFLTKVIEFAGVDSAQDQRLVRIHSSLQNLEATLSSS